MPLVSVIVPIYNVEEYLPACLDSIARQTVEDLEVIMVNDGSTDGSANIAEEFAARDSRFRLLTQPNGGLSRARNTGAEAATGEYLAFADSDDLLPRNAYELLVTPLQETGSDFATGNVNRLTPTGIAPTGFLSNAFDRSRRATHVTKFRPLLADRTAWNKLWRRSFWEAHGFRFPEGMVHEDIPVVLPAHFAANSVDVVAEPVYLYRVRAGADLSITQRRLEKKALLDRLKAVEHVHAYLEREGPRKAKRWYEQSVVAQDFSYYLNVLDSADEDYRSLFLERVNAFLDRAHGRLYDDLPAIDRLKWHLVRRRLMPELVEVINFQKKRMGEIPPVRVRRSWYGDYPFRTDSKLAIPRSVYRLGRELALSPRVDDLRFDGNELRISGYAFIAGIGAPSRESQRVTVTVVRRGGLRRIRTRLAPIRLHAEVRHRPDVASTTQSSADVAWSGFEATLPLRRLRTLGRWQQGIWDLHVKVRAGSVTRRRARFLVDGPRPVRAVDRVLPDGVLLRAAPAPRGEIAVHALEGGGTVTGHRLRDATVELSGRLGGASRAALRLARVGSKPLEYPMNVGADGEFSVNLPLAELEAAAEAADLEPHGEGIAWDLWLVEGGRRDRLALDGSLREPVWPGAGRELTLMRTKDGDAALVAREPHPLVLDARWTDGGELELSGELSAGSGLHELVLKGRLHLERHTFPVGFEDGRFHARLTPAHVRSLAGELPLREDTWELYALVAPGTRAVRVILSQTLYERLPLKTAIDHKTFMLGLSSEQHALVIAHCDLDDESEGGHFHQRRLRDTVYARRREAPLREAVAYESFGGYQCSDSPRAIHEELVRRGAPLDHLWVVRDGSCVVPPSASALRAGSHEHYEAMATARFVVVNDYFPDWFVRRSDQVCVQALHGTPLKRIGLDVPHLRSTIRRSWRWSEQVHNWQYLLSPNAFCTPILRRAFGVEGEVVESGLPRNDVLALPDADARGREVRRRLRLPAGARVVLYAPTYRDHVVDRRGRYRLDLQLDLERLRAAAGDDAVLLFRKHPFVEDLVPTGDGGLVRDVSTYPDATELLLAADVLVTDYSSLMFDFANTGRPMLFFAYDLDVYEHDIRGFYLDFRAKAPGPLMTSTDDLLEALSALRDGVPSEYAERYSAFASTFCALDDGRAAARVVDRLFA